MMTNNKPWQTVVNPNNLASMPKAQNNLAAVGKNENAVKPTATIKVVMPKRFNFDDNGGGYQGL